MFSAEPADGNDSSSIPTGAAMYVARSRPMTMYVPFSDAVTILYCAPALAANADSIHAPVRNDTDATSKLAHFMSVLRTSIQHSKANRSYVNRSAAPRVVRLPQ